MSKALDAPKREEEKNPTPEETKYYNVICVSINMSCLGKYSYERKINTDVDFLQADMPVHLKAN